MSAVTISRPIARPAPAGVRFSGLLNVEARKLVDTRSGAILLAALPLAATAILLAWVGYSDQPASWMELASYATLAPSTFVPLLAILAVTAEWTHHTAMTTFALEPRRGRVLAAKLLVAVGLAVAMELVVYLLSGLVLAAGAPARGWTPDWSFDANVFASTLAGVILHVCVAVALALLFANGPAALVTYLVGPTVILIVGAAGAWLAQATSWISLANAIDPVTSGDWAAIDWGRLCSALAFWLLVPGAIGWVRQVRREIS